MTRLLRMLKSGCPAGGLGAAFQVTLIQDTWPAPAAEPEIDDLAPPGATSGDAAALEGGAAPASLGSGQGQSWQMRLVVVQEALALLRALLMHPSLGQLPQLPPTHTMLNIRLMSFASCLLVKSSRIADGSSDHAED